ncbi:MAG: hypothetical protein ACYDCJ_12895 [Gammaproteobacteria bacterium]
MSALPLLSVEEANARFGEYRDLLEAVIAEDRLHSMTLEYAQLAIAKGALRVLYDGQSLVTFAIQGGIVNLVHGAGELSSVQATVASIETEAKAAGAQKIRLFGRPGWPRHLPGYQVLGTLLEKSL